MSNTEKPQPRTLDEALALMRDLRARCEWDRAQTHQSLRPYLIEEAHEVDEAIDAGDDPMLRDELGDLLLQVLFHAVVAEERNAFGINDIAGALVTKMHARHPHLYGDGVRRDWESLKTKQKKRSTLEEGVPRDLSALHRAHRLQDRAAGAGFDWPDTDGPLEKVREELGEVEAQLHNSEPADTRESLEAELGDLLFATVNLCRKAGIHASLALDSANRKFVARYDAMQKLAAARGVEFAALELAQQDELWNEVKRTV